MAMLIIVERRSDNPMGGGRGRDVKKSLML